MNVESLFPKKYLTKEDLDGDTPTKILGIEAVEMENDNGATETKHVLVLEGLKPMVINRTNSNTIVEMYGGETDGWNGKPIVLFVDTTVQMKGKVVGGLRIRNGHSPAGVGAVPVISPEQAGELFKLGRANDWPKESIQQLVKEVAEVDSMRHINPQFRDVLEKHLSYPYKAGAEADVIADDIPF